MSLTQTVTWIPCAERLPKESLWSDYLVAFVSGATSSLLRFDGHWRMSGDYDNVYEDICITHWALPLTHPAQLQAEGEK